MCIICASFGPNLVRQFLGETSNGLDLPRLLSIYNTKKDSELCEFVYKFEYDNIGNITVVKDSVLDGLRWDEALKDKFKLSDPDEKRAEVIKTVEEIEKILQKLQNDGVGNMAPNAVVPESVPSKDTIQECRDKEDLRYAEKYCLHDWMQYQGAGTKAPETICRSCGLSKK